ncbi:MAG: carboxymuconolactone decarboxylase family protein [Rhizobiales bacterium]|nr:carboxymuconolactone decarboxylase family protein [Hyphomicrobiales bacterium]
MAPLPFDPAKLDANGRAIYERLKAHRAAQGAPFSGPYLALMNNPELTEKIEALGYYLKFEGTLPREVYQFTVLTVAIACGADFEWHDHVEHARAAGIPDRVIEAVRNHSAIGDEPYATALPVIEAAFKWRDVPQSAQDAAIARFGVKAYVELVVVTGFYQMFSSVNQGFAVR